ncbi:MAG: MmgE/PrpD family protein [Gammaproteobacteria bacterium]|nr:MmgE/PrpD family protein [Gammaproteobacteria bacterium]
MSYTEQLAVEVLATPVPDAVARDQLNKLLLDHLGCCIRGAELPWGLRMRDWVRAQAATGGAPVFGESITTSVANAAFANATAAHGLELDDTHDESISHPGSAVIASCLASGVDGQHAANELLAAVVAGYEVVGRAGAATNAAHVVEHGFHPTSLFAGFGAVAALARMKKLDPAQLQRAWGLMLSMAGGSMQFSQEAVGTTVKRLHGGLAALHAVLAVDLVQLGVEGPEQALDGRYGLLNLFGNDQDPARLARSHSDGPEIHRVSFKAYPCCRFFHSTLDALIEVTDDFAVDASSIVRYTVGGPEVLSTQHVLRRPESEMAAQYSLPFVIGAATIHGPRSVDGYTESALSDDRILAIADKVDVVSDERLQEQFPGHFGSWLEIEMADGERRRVGVLDSIGTPANPMTLLDLERKFDSLVGPTGIGLSGADAITLLTALDDEKSLRTLLAKVRERGHQ